MRVIVAIKRYIWRSYPTLQVFPVAVIRPGHSDMAKLSQSGIHDEYVFTYFYLCKCMSVTDILFLLSVICFNVSDIFLVSVISCLVSVIFLFSV